MFMEELDAAMEALANLADAYEKAGWSKYAEEMTTIFDRIESIQATYVAENGGDLAFDPT